MQWRWDALPEGEDGVLDNYTKVRLNQLVERGAHIFLYARGARRRRQSESRQEYAHRFPVCILNGAALYDPKKGTFTAVESFSEEAVGKLGNLLEKNGFSVFTYCVSHGNLSRCFLTNWRMKPWRNGTTAEVRSAPGELCVCIPAGGLFGAVPAGFCKRGTAGVLCGRAAKRRRGHSGKYPLGGGRRLPRAATSSSLYPLAASVRSGGREAHGRTAGLCTN